MTSTHVLLGGNGVVGRATATALLARGESVASVGRRTATVDGVESRLADLLVAREVDRALAGARVAYLVAGLPYSSRIWSEQWPVIVRNAIDAAVANAAHLVYFDNVYAYGRVDGAMTEQTPIDPCSRKGRVRADALAALAEASASRGLRFTVGRSADFFGPGATTSVLNRFALAPIAAGRPGSWLVDAEQPHSLSYTPDLGEGLATLGTEPAAAGRVWHLPTAPALSGREYLALAGGPAVRIRVMGAGTLRLGALFSSDARETLEMAYQYDSPYRFDSGAAERELGLAPTPTDRAIAASLAALRP